MTDEANDLPTPKAPTVTSNSQAAALACRTERGRVLRILALTDVPPQILAAIESGTPAAQVERKQAKPAQPAGSTPALPAQQSGGSKWGGITSRMNTRRQAQGDQEPGV